MKFKTVFQSLIVVLLLSPLYSCKKETKKPNIIIILADDLGYGDPEVYNPDSKIPTPNINLLAKEGMRFTDAHTPSSVCTPTRYGLLTGRYSWRTELKNSVLWMWDRPLIDSTRQTLPKMLKKEDYTTACIGKWHLGWRWPSNKDNHFMNDTIKIGDYNLKGRNKLWKNIDFSKALGGGPLEAGFDYYFGDDVPNFAPYAFIENDKLLKIPNQEKPNDMYGGPGPMTDGWALEKVMPTITKKAVNYIEEQAEKENPFFLYFALTAPHTPIAPTDDFKGKSKAGLYGDFVNEVDWSVGQIVEVLKKTGQLENTILIFTSDNGSPQRDGQAMGGAIASVLKYGHNPSGKWRGMKADIWEGGHRVPFVVSWPKKIKENSISDKIVCTTDIMATVASILEIPNDNIKMEDSFDFSNVLLNEQNDNLERSSIIHHAIDGTFAIRQAEWKLILGKDSAGFSRGLKIEGIPVNTNGQLYNLKEDPYEKNNLYDTFPTKVKALSDLLHEHKSRGYSNSNYLK